MIKSRRMALHFSQGELAKTAGVSVRPLARYEASEQQPALSAAVSLADAVGISLAQLAGGASRPRTATPRPSARSTTTG